MSDTYRGWSISWDYGYFNATGPNYDASWEGDEDGWVSNGEEVTSRTREGLIEEIDLALAAAGFAGDAPLAAPPEGPQSGAERATPNPSPPHIRKEIHDDGGLGRLFRLS